MTANGDVLATFGSVPYCWKMQVSMRIRCWRRMSGNSARGGTPTRAVASSSRLPAIWRPIHRPNAHLLFRQPTSPAA